MLAAITDRTRIIMLCTPNNPTGTVLTTQAVQDFIDRVPEHILVVIDEAYIEFIRREDAVDGIAMYRQYPNVAVLRTFSKAHGLANLRIGYSVAPAGISQPLKVINPPFAASMIARRSLCVAVQFDEVLANTEKVVAGDVAWEGWMRWAITRRRPSRILSGSRWVIKPRPSQRPARPGRYRCARSHRKVFVSRSAKLRPMID